MFREHRFFEKSQLITIAALVIFPLACKSQSGEIESNTLDNSASATKEPTERESENGYKNFEQPPEDEASDIAKVLGAMKHAVQLKHDQGNPPPILRFTHAKTLGCVAAKFIVPNDLPDDLREGLFKQPATYNTWIRFSNFAFSAQSDAMPDNRGMALKLLDVPGPKLQPGSENDRNLDLVLTTDVSFFFESPKKFLNFLQVSATKGPQEWFKQNPDAAKVHQRAVKSGILGGLFEGIYGSMTPYRYGRNRAAKFVAKPCSQWERGAAPSVPGKADNYLSQGLKDYMDEGKTACFNIYAQFFVDQTATPIENPSIDWTEQNATPRRVAQLIIPPQPSNQIVANQKTCEHFSFSPWRTIKDHEPLGGINRLRKVIYKELSQQRHHLNREPNKEPGLETFPKL